MASFAPFRLPEYETPRNAMLDFSPFSEAVKDYQAAKTNTARLGMEQERLGLQKESNEREKEKHTTAMEADAVNRMAGISQMILDEKDPAKKLQRHEQFLASRRRADGPTIKEYLAKYLPPEVIADPDSTHKYVVTTSRGWTNPLDDQAKRADIAKTQAQTNLYGVQATAAAAKPSDTFDLGPDHTRFQQVRKPDGSVEAVPIAKGPPSQKVDPITQKAIDEADDFVMQTKGALGSLKAAQQLNQNAYSGAGASGRAGFVNNTIPTTASRNTADLENLVISQALQSLRSTFGGNPTEGERRILLDVAGSVNQPADVRERIFQRAEAQANKRLLFNQQKAAALRSGTYYKPGGQPSMEFTDAPTPSDGQGADRIPRITGDADFDALPSGARFIDPNGKVRTKP